MNLLKETTSVMQITIYQFDSEDELSIVLAHEFGHALELDHVAGEKSVMYHFMEKQDVVDGLSHEDRAEFDRVCSQEQSISSTFGSIIGLW
jgi:predicted Zn-dependent protease